MFLSKEEKILVLLYRIQKQKALTLLGQYQNYSIGENKIKRLENKIIKLGGNLKTEILLQ